jgi:hypothetical protein
MADYYPILTRAVSGLPHNDALARRDLYARARTIVAEQLRARQPQATTQETMREQAALETAIRRVETESLPRSTQAPRKPVAAPRQAAAVADAQQRVDNTARSLSKILQAVQPDAGTQRKGRKSMNGAQALAPAAELPSPAIGAKETSNPSAELGGAPNSFGTLLFATAYIVAALAFTGVTYIRCMVWLYQGVIGYPILLAIMAFTLALFIAPPLMFFKKTSALPSMDALMRYIHSASRRAL